MFGLNIFHSFLRQSGHSITGFWLFYLVSSVARKDLRFFCLCLRRIRRHSSGCVCVHAIVAHFFHRSRTRRSEFLLHAEKNENKRKETRPNTRKTTQKQTWTDWTSACSCTRLFLPWAAAFLGAHITDTGAAAAFICLFGNLVCTKNLDSLGKHTSVINRQYFGVVWWRAGPGSVRLQM